MAGHSKWANIKHKKQANDAKRSSIFSKMSRLITSAVTEGGGIPDPEINIKLRMAVDRAKEANMAKDTIQRAIDKASKEGLIMQSALYEGFAPGGVAMLISVISDNLNRSLTEVKTTLDKQGGKIAGQNAVSHMFTQCGVIELDKKSLTEEQAFELFDQLDGIDLESTDESYILFISFDSIGKAEGVLGTIAPNTKAMSIDTYYLPQSPIEADAKTIQKVEHLIEKLEDLDDVQSVYTNMNA